MKSLYRLVVASIFLCAIQAQAVVVTYTFDALIVGGPFDGQIAPGSFSFDDSLLVTGDEVLGIADGLLVTFDFDGQTFFEFNDVDEPDYPQLTFSNFMPVILDYILVDGQSGVIFNDPGLAGMQGVMYDLYSPTGGADFDTEMVFGYPVPLPASAWFMASACMALFGIGTKRKRQ